MEGKRLKAYLRRNLRDAEDAALCELQTVRQVGESTAEHIGIARPILAGSAPTAVAIAVAGACIEDAGHVEEIARDILQITEFSHPGQARQ